MIEVRLLKKKDGRSVLQFRKTTELYKFEDGYGYVKRELVGEWEDVPVAYGS